MFRLALSLIIVCGIAQGFQQVTGSTWSEKERDVYAIYSLILTNPKTSHGPDNNSRYLIAGTTVPGPTKEPCVRPPEDRKADFQEVLADYQSRGITPREIRPAFSIPKPYLLLSPDELNEFMKERFSPNIGEKANARFEGVADVFRLSDVYFNHRRTLALTAISTWCGGLCGLMQWKVVEKQDTGKWEERPWVGCITIAQVRRPGESSPR
jgi:hypothetical protein